ncbi:MAG TPA: glutathione S-transferase family protein [Woeseiaceae bacterium]|nr:glutathione S-transferase family protein [Woeseiaceae bacterium]
MKLYDCQTAPSPRRVRIFAAEKGIDLDKVEIDLRAGEQFSDAFRAVNPDCVVPVLELDDGTRITEVMAICDYIESAVPEPTLIGQAPLARARVLEWNTKVEQQGLLAMADLLRNAAKGFKDRALTGPAEYAQIPELAERGRRRVTEFLGRLDERLADKVFIAGDDYSMADITALVLVDFAGWMKIGMPEEAGNLQRWYGAVSRRPSARA